MKLKRVDIFQAETIRGATKISTELRYRIEVRLLCRRRQIADRHVLDHPAAKRADLSHRKTSCLMVWAAKNPRPSQSPSAKFGFMTRDLQRAASDERIIARRMKAATVLAHRSKSRARRRKRLSHAKVRSKIQRLGKTS